MTSTPSSGWVSTYRRALPRNPHVKYFDEKPGGYARCVVAPDSFRTECKLARNVAVRLSPVKTVTTFDVAAEATPTSGKEPSGWKPSRT